MTTTDTAVERVTASLEASGPAPSAASGRRAASLAMGLWVVVGGLLAYGIVQTVLKASALLG